MTKWGHYLARVKGGSYPTQIVGLAVGVSRQDDPSNPRRQTEHLDGWHAFGVSGRSGDYGPEREACGDGEEDLWTQVARRLRVGGVLWAISWFASRSWGLLGLWRRVAGGRLLCGLPCNNRKSVDRRSNRAGPQSASVLSDPPTVIDVRMRSLPGTLRIVDARNWGCRNPAPPRLLRDEALRALRLGTGMAKVLRDHGMGGLQTTAGSQSLHTYKRAHLETPILCHTHPSATVLERSALWGGRAECFRLGRIAGKCYHLDCSSMYGSLYRTANLPVRLVGCEENPPQEVAEQLAEDWQVIAEVDIEVEEPIVPTQHDGLTVWPVGRIRTSLCGPELSHLCSLGAIRRWRRIAWYECEPALASYGEEWLALRDTMRQLGEEDLERWCKAMLVCLPGKFAAHGHRWVDRPEVTALTDWGRWRMPDKDGLWYLWRALEWRTQRLCEQELAHDTSPAISAWITSLGRVQLWDWIKCAGVNQVYHVHTDGLWVSEVGYQRLQESGHVCDIEWGRLREKGQSHGIHIGGIGQVEAQDGRISSGQPGSSDAAGSEAGTYWYAQSVGEAIGSKRRPESERILKPYRRTDLYRHGVRHLDGRVWPLRLEQW